MDQRLQQIGGLRPHRLTQNEVPAVARGICAYMRRRALVDKHLILGVSCIRISNQASGIDALVRADDWAKILPYLKDGSFDPTVVPVLESVVLNPIPNFDSSVIELRDRELFNRIVGVLNRLFPVTYPTSNF